MAWWFYVCRHRLEICFLEVVRKMMVVVSRLTLGPSFAASLLCMKELINFIPSALGPR